MRPWGVALGTLVTCAAAVAQAPLRPGTVDITIAVQSPDSAHVEERYHLGASSRPLELRVLTRPCARIENLRFERDGDALAVAQTRQGPWITFRDTTPSEGDSLRLSVGYDVRLAGTSAVPLVHLATAVTPDDATRIGPVKVEVRLADREGRVSFPHMSRQAPGEWSARYVAVPSFVQLADLPLTRCDEGAKERGDNGGLVWRFFLLVGIMVAWVPLYLAWARRSGDNA